MNLVKYMLCPTGSFDGFWKLSVLVGLVVAAERVLNCGLFGAPWTLWSEDVLMTAVIAAPAFLAAFRVVRQLDRLQKQLAHLAGTDLLTELPNRRAFMEAVEARPGSTGQIVMILDADHFKRINDTYGHDVGDLCLKQIADLLRSHLKDGRLVARIGGEEFAMILPEEHRLQAYDVGRAIAQGTAIEAEAVGEDLHITLSVGATEWSLEDDLADVMRRADEALYHAKRAGRARLVIHLGDRRGTWDTEALEGAPDERAKSDAA